MSSKIVHTNTFPTFGVNNDQLCVQSVFKLITYIADLYFQTTSAVKRTPNNRVG